MARTTKTSVDRRAALIEAAIKLFTDKGIPDTKVSDIVREVGVAQGTFYWHFESKQEIINTIVEAIAERNCRHITEISESEEIGAIEKFAVCANEIFSELISDSDVLKYFHREGNEQAHGKLNKELASRLVPALARIIRQGVNEKVFNVDDPEKAALFVFGAALLVNDSIISDGGGPTGPWKTAVLEFVLRGLGSDPASIDKVAGR